MRPAIVAVAACGVTLLASAAPPGRPHPIVAWLPPESLPSEPATRTLSPDEAAAALERDWLFQCDGRPSPGAVKSEIQRARRIARSLAEGPLRVDVSAALDRLAAIEASGKGATAPRRISLRPDGIAGRWSFEGTDD